MRRNALVFPVRQHFIGPFFRILRYNLLTPQLIQPFLLSFLLIFLNYKTVSPEILRLYKAFSTLYSSTLFNSPSPSISSALKYPPTTSDLLKSFFSFEPYASPTQFTCQLNVLGTYLFPCTTSSSFHTGPSSSYPPLMSYQKSTTHLTTTTYSSPGLFSFSHSSNVNVAHFTTLAKISETHARHTCPKASSVAPLEKR